jgi:hypothetical protein
VTAPHEGIHFMNFACKSVRREPFDHRGRI